MIILPNAMYKAPFGILNSVPFFILENQLKTKQDFNLGCLDNWIRPIKIFYKNCGVPVKTRYILRMAYLSSLVSL